MPAVGCPRDLTPPFQRRTANGGIGALSWKARVAFPVAAESSNHATLVALAAVPSAAVLSVPAVHAPELPCDAAPGCPTPQHAVAPKSELNLPNGLTQCPDSGLGAACATEVPSGADGAASLPESQTACPSLAAKPLPSTPAACSDVVLGGRAPSTSTISSSPIEPSVPVASLGTRWSSQKLDLKVSAASHLDCQRDLDRRRDRDLRPDPGDVDRRLRPGQPVRGRLLLPGRDTRVRRLHHAAHLQDSVPR